MGLVEARDYSVQLRCFSAPFFPKYDRAKINELNYGGKILLPNSALDNLIRKNIQWPMLFKLSTLDPECQRVTHAGVLEFLAEEGRCYLPSWMASQLSLREGDFISVEYKSLPSATYAKFKPLASDFLHVSNPRAMLEVELRKFACLTKNDVIAIQYNEQLFEFKVMDLKPANAVTIIECDVNIEFDTPEGYVEPKYNEVQKKSKAAMPPAPTHHQEVESTGWTAFSGRGMRLDGKADTSKNNSQPSTSKSNTADKSVEASKNAPIKILVDEDYKPGTLQFIRHDYKNLATMERLAKETKKNDPFLGKGSTIKGQ